MVKSAQHNLDDRNSVTMPSPSSTGTDEFIWSDDFSVGHPEIDQMHREFVSLIGTVCNSNEIEVEEHFSQLCEHLQRHFREESSLMTKYEYPVAQCHEDEHARVLQSVHDIQSLASTLERIKSIRLFGRALMDWFPGHTTYMDSPLSHWISKQRFGGKPVVVRKISSMEA